MKYPLLFLIVLIAPPTLSADREGNRQRSESADIAFHGTLIEVPPCVVNDGQQVVVDFGDEIMTTRVDGIQYKQRIAFTVDCGVAFSPLQKVRIEGSPADFDPTVLNSNLAGFGIALYHDDARYTPGKWLAFNDADLPALYAAPIKQDGITLGGGAFSVLASLVVDYQ